MKNIYYIVFAALLFSACEKIVELDIPSDKPGLVIESQITNMNEPWVVQLSLSQAYFDNSELDPLSTATVSITGTDGSSVVLSHSDSGMYVSADSHSCIIGETYTLNVSYNSVKYTASEILANGFEIDTIQDYNLPEGNGFIEAGIYVFIKGRQNAYLGDSYLWKYYVNDSLRDDFGIFLENDEFGSISMLNEDIDLDDLLGGIEEGVLPRPFPFVLEQGDSVRVEQYSISPLYFQFLLDMQAQKSRNGSPFDPPPANPFNNLSNGALGYFSVAHVVAEEITIE